VISDALDDALDELTLADILAALVTGDSTPTLLAFLARADALVNDAAHDDRLRAALATLPPETRRILATLAVDTLAEAIGPLVRDAVTHDMKALADRASLSKLAGTLAELTTPSHA